MRHAVDDIFIQGALTEGYIPFLQTLQDVVHENSDIARESDKDPASLFTLMTLQGNNPEFIRGCIHGMAIVLVGQVSNPDIPASSDLGTMIYQLTQMGINLITGEKL